MRLYYYIIRRVICQVKFSVNFLRVLSIFPCFFQFQNFRRIHVCIQRRYGLQFSVNGSGTGSDQFFQFFISLPQPVSCGQ